jgi:hypothetical protein
MMPLAWLLCVLVSAGTILAANTPAPDPIKDCPSGLICFTVKEGAAIDRTLAEFDRMKKMKKIFGWHATCGIGIGAVATDKFDIKAAPVGYCGVGFGF